ncbi:MAG: orotate phosphoribosyltransferase [Desulfitobacteriaceae bacterium]|nr:orotate phosphoribosyltransferase [Desulfitobacteriaceae bacterium]MDD4751944.1 orotate phosphoribosyltransferase [Desulfitobacteriaceae bacterium]
MLSQDQALDLFRKSGALLEGHFLLTSGRHSNRYVQCAQVLQYPEFTSLLCQEIADRFRNDGVDIVIGPAMGGILVAYEVSRHLGVKNMFAERENGVMTLRRGFCIEPGAKVLIVEDVITTGGSVREVAEMVIAQGGKVAGIGVLVDRSGGKVQFDAKLEAVINMEVPSWTEEDCPLCREGIPAMKPGSRKIK